MKQSTGGQVNCCDQETAPVWEPLLRRARWPRWISHPPRPSSDSTRSWNAISAGRWLIVMQVHPSACCRHVSLLKHGPHMLQQGRNQAGLDVCTAACISSSNGSVTYHKR